MWMQVSLSYLRSAGDRPKQNHMKWIESVIGKTRGKMKKGKELKEEWIINGTLVELESNLVNVQFICEPFVYINEKWIEIVGYIFGNFLFLLGFHHSVIWWPPMHSSFLLRSMTIINYISVTHWLGFIFGSPSSNGET